MYIHKLCLPSIIIVVQVYAEFRRVTGKELMETFFTSLDEHTRGLIRVYRTVAHHPSQVSLKTLLEYLDDQVRNNGQMYLNHLNPTGCPESLRVKN